MAPSFTELEAQALQLSPQDRAQLADRLLSSLASDPAVEDAWAVEVDRRINEFEADEVRDIPVEESLARARAAIR
jgi:putative addiction module component (TIGR02574 family)